MNSRRTNRGFTLLELTFTIMIVSVLSVVGSKMLSQGFNAYLTGENIIQADWQGRIAMERMVRDIHNLPTYNSIISASTTASQLSFTSFSNSTITFSRSGTQLLLNGNVLANNVQSLTFTYYDANGNVLTAPPGSALCYILITLQISTTRDTYTLTTAVYPWGLQ